MIAKEIGARGSLKYEGFIALLAKPKGSRIDVWLSIADV
jgi:hypothetical protein